MTEENVLLVDDDGEMLVSLSRALKATGITAAIHAASRHDKALEILLDKNPQVAVVDLSLDEKTGVESGFALIRDILANDSTCRIIVLTGHSSLEHGVRAVNMGAANFLEKPADPAHLSALITDGLSQSDIRRAFSRLAIQKTNFIQNPVIGNSSVMQALLKEVEYASRNSLPVLISGETGTGKGLIAKTIHLLSERAKKNFVRYQANFGTADLVNSDLFGHQKGSFTGAAEDRKGLFAEAEGGTFFLDEIDELPLEVQVTLLGVLQDKKYRVLGGNKELPLDIRLISATNQDPDKCLADGKIRKDFFHRIAHVKLHIPPLRDHREDIAELCKYFISKIRDAENLSVLSIEDGALNNLSSYDWPGNVRELEAVIEGAMHRAQYEGRTSISSVDVQTGRSGAQASGENFHDQVKNFKLKLIKDKLSQVGGNQLKAAKELGLDRSTLRRLLEEK
jgi:DNA-binding NtrC family response regulator